MAKGRPWTGAEEVRLRKAIANGMSRVEICEMLGREKDTVRRKCHKLGIRLPATVRTFNYDDRVYDPPVTSIVSSSQRLEMAINALLEKMPRGMRAECLGSLIVPTPGTERVHKTASIERMAA